jgi:hypothetical protein
MSTTSSSPLCTISAACPSMRSSMTQALTIKHLPRLGRRTSGQGSVSAAARPFPGSLISIRQTCPHLKQWR